MGACPVVGVCASFLPPDPSEGKLSAPASKGFHRPQLGEKESTLPCLWWGKHQWYYTTATARGGLPHLKHAQQLQAEIQGPKNQ